MRAAGAAVCALASQIGGCITVLHRRPGTMHVPPQGAAQPVPALFPSVPYANACGSQREFREIFKLVDRDDSNTISKQVVGRACPVAHGPFRARVAQELQRLMATLSIHATPVSPSRGLFGYSSLPSTRTGGT